jgi:ketosteroid isomerase-like protein
MTETEDVILSVYAAYRRGDADDLLSHWHEDAQFKAIATERLYQGLEEIRFFFTNEINESIRTDFKVYTVLEQEHLALVFGRYTEREGEHDVEKGAFWIAEVTKGKILRWEGFAHVGEAFAEFKQRLGLEF